MVCVVKIVMMIIVVVGLPIMATNLIYYCFFISPCYFLKRPLAFSRRHQWITLTALVAAYILSIARLPYIILPYLAKLCFFFIFKENFQTHWNRYSTQLIRLVADFANLPLTTFLFAALFNPLQSESVWLWLYIAFSAELIRLLMEKGQTIFSAVWQKIPHKFIAERSTSLLTLHTGENFFLQTARRYRDYYRLSPDEKASAALLTMKHLAAGHPEITQKLRYTNSFRIVPKATNLRAGKVRDVAKGEIFIHQEWTNDPWLLTGQLMRRTPWFFDPRYLSRPFYYRTQSNRLVTSFVLQHGTYTLPYAWYQLGQEIKAARYDLFYRILKGVGLDIEPPVKEDGTFAFDQFIHWLGKQWKMDNMAHNKRPLWTDEEAIAQIVARKDQGEVLQDLEIATQYTYPLCYVQEIVMPQIETGFMKTQKK